MSRDWKKNVKYKTINWSAIKKKKKKTQNAVIIIIIIIIMLNLSDSLPPKQVKVVCVT